MRTHGWGGDAPASDEEAVARILTAAGQTIDTRGAELSIADVARTLGLTRQTVYRYFPSTDALLVAMDAANGFLDRLAGQLTGITDPAEAVTSEIAMQFATSMLLRFDIDWAAMRFSDDDLTELAEHLLRNIQSFVIDPGRPPRRGDQLLAYLRRWVASALRPAVAQR